MQQELHRETLSGKTKTTQKKSTRQSCRRPRFSPQHPHGDSAICTSSSWGSDILLCPSEAPGTLPTVSCHTSSQFQTTLGLNPSTYFLSIQSATSHSFPYSTIMVLKSHTCCEECGTDFVRSNLKLCFLLHLILQKHMMVDCWLFLPSFPLWQSFVMQSWWLILFSSG